MRAYLAIAGEKEEMGNRVVIATWDFGLLAVEGACEALDAGRSTVDAVEVGVNRVELAPDVTSVGYGGLPNRDGIVELDAAIIDTATHSSGAVAGMRGFARPISVARRVMERLPHALIVGEGADAFAREQGFVEEELLTDRARTEWEEWRRTEWEEWRRTGAKMETHDTVGLIALSGDSLVVGCSTSGLAWKHPGRVGDSPILGAGIYADSDVGAAVATGNGDEISRVCLCSRVVFMMEKGLSAQEACDESLRYLAAKRGHITIPMPVAVLAVRADGTWGVAANHPDFPFAVHDGGVTRSDIRRTPVC